jgi:hypothetical protein
MSQSVLARVAALKTTPTPGLKALWREMFAAEPPPYNRRYMEGRLAYRLQELAFGGLKPETIERLDALADELGDGGKIPKVRRPLNDRPITGTRLIREWKGVEHTITVHDDFYEWEGRPYESLSVIARAITGTRWNGWTFFGLKNQRGRS